ncbi:MAG: class I SAM-dependent methyltransferase [Acidimicrobiales bacterium]
MDSEDWDRRYDTSELVWTAVPNQFLVAEVASLVPGTALDLGAGEGRNAIWLAQQGWQVTAVDFSEVGLAKARQLAAASGVEVTTVHADVVVDNLAYDRFDLVVVLYLHLVPSSRRIALRRAADAVAPHGMLLVLGHDLDNIAHGCGGPQDPEILFTPDDVVAEIEGSGLTIEKAERAWRTVVTPDGERTAIDALVRAHRPDR